jgi:hypothetical protein
MVYFLPARCGNLVTQPCVSEQSHYDIVSNLGIKWKAFTEAKPGAGSSQLPAAIKIQIIFFRFQDGPMSQ